MKRKLMLLLAFLVIGIGLLNAQTRKVSGVVISAEDGQPVIGASVLVVGTTLGTITDYEGTFVISDLPTTAEFLKISYVGMRMQKVAIKNKMKIVMKSDSKALDGIVVVAYGTMKKNAFTGSASSVDSKKIEMRQVSSATNALSGTTSGVQVTNTTGRPGSDPSIRIRGIGSISASSTPLYIVDGAPYDGNISSINPTDIANINVLKDASASAIYGARGANGVILITTKRGKSGEAKVTFDAKWGVNNRLMDAGNVIKDAGTYYESYYRSLYNANYYGEGAGNATTAHAYARKNLISDLGYQVYTVPNGEQLIGNDFKLNPNATLGYSDGTYYYTPDDWTKEMFKENNLRQEYNASISGSNDKINYYMSMGYLDDSGIIKGSSYTRYTGRLKVDYQAKKWLKVGANLSFSHIDDKGLDSDDYNWGSSGNPFFVSDMMAPIYPYYVRNANDKSIKIDNHGMIVYDLGTNTGQKRGNSGATGNPAVSLNYDKVMKSKNVFSGSTFAEISLYDGLKFKTNLSFYDSETRSNSLSNPYYLTSSRGSISVASYRSTTLNQQFLLTYNKKFGNHDVSLLAGYETYEHKYSKLLATKKTIYLDNVAELDNAVSASGLPSSYTKTYATKGLFFRSQYNYNGKYFGTISYRHDASSRFASGKKWGDFGSLGAAWLMSKEKFLTSTSSWLNLLKFKVSYGIQGNDNLGNYYPYLDQYTLSVADDAPTLVFSYKGNKDITWETSYSFNTGFEFELWNGLLTGSIDYYNRRTVDMLYFKPVAVSKGYRSIPVNSGEMYNRGIELNLNSNLYHSKDVDINLNLNLTTIKNRITDIQKYQTSQAIYKTGGSIYSAYLREYVGVYGSDRIGNVSGSRYKFKDGLQFKNGDALYYVDPDNGDYSLTNNWKNASRKDFGDTLADIYGGFGFSARIYGFDASVQFGYQLGGKIYDSAYQAMMSSDGSNTWSYDIQNAWTPTNTNTDVPRLDQNKGDSQNSSSRFLVSSDYLSLNNITIGYTVSPKWVRKFKINSLRFYISGENLALWSHRDGLDSRRSTAGGIQSVTNKYASGQYSALTTITGGVSVSF